MHIEQEREVAVTTAPGMFTNEVLAFLTVADGSTVSFFVDKSLFISQAERLGVLKLPFVKRDAARELDVLMLPVETLETGARWIELPLE